MRTGGEARACRKSEGLPQGAQVEREGGLALSRGLTRHVEVAGTDLLDEVLCTEE